MRRAGAVPDLWWPAGATKKLLPLAAQVARVLLMLGGLVGVTLPAWAGFAGTVWAQAPRGELEVRPRGVPDADLDTALPAGILEKIKGAVPAGARVQQYLFVPLEDGALAIGLDPVNAPFRTPRGGFRPKLTAGRLFKAEDAEHNVAVVGTHYAETHKTPFGFRIAEMVYPGHTPGITLGGERVEVVGIFESGTPEGDNAMVLPLAPAQQRLQKPGVVHRVLIATRPGTALEPLKQALQSALGGEVEVRVVGR